MYGWAGTILRVDLTRRKIQKESTEKYIPDFIGNRGINTKILYDEVKPGIDPYDPENRLIIGVPPLAGTSTPANSRVTITAKSPMTGLAGDSGIGGFFGAELKYAGYDNIVISGISRNPVYLWINNEDAVLRDADGVRGKDTFETQKILQEELGDPDVQSLCIGPAGENVVRFANIKTLLKNAAGRPGLGAVMGSKRLKAIAVRGTKGVKVARPDELLDISMEMYKIVLDFPEKDSHNTTEMGYGESMALGFDIEEDLAGVLKSFHSWYKDIPKRKNLLLDFLEDYGAKYVGCYGCPRTCYTWITIPGIGTNPIACASLIDFTARIMNPDPKFMFEATMLCNKYGMDVISIGGAISFVMDLYERGILKKEDLDGITPEWGSKEAARTLIHKIAKREGIGDLLAEGEVRAAKKIGKNAIKSSLNVKGLELYGHDPRVRHGLGLGIAVSSRPDITRSEPTFERFDIPIPKLSESETRKRKEKLDEYRRLCKQLFGTEKATYHDAYEGKAEAIVWMQHHIAIMDCVGICKMIGWDINAYAHPPVPTWTYNCGLTNHELLARALSAATGRNYDAKNLELCAERVINLERAFNAREGETRKDDTIPEAFFTTPIPDGIHKGDIMDREKFETMKDRFYELRGWDKAKGLPTRKKLEELNLKYVADELERLKII